VRSLVALETTFLSEQRLKQLLPSPEYFGDIFDRSELGFLVQRLHASRTEFEKNIPTSPPFSEASI
jgi:hypothetical protein